MLFLLKLLTVAKGIVVVTTFSIVGILSIGENKDYDNGDVRDEIPEKSPMNFHTFVEKYGIAVVCFAVLIIEAISDIVFFFYM